MIALILILIALAIAGYAAYRLKPSLLMPLHKSLALWSQRLNLGMSFLIAYIVQSNGAPIAALGAYLPAPLQAIQGPLSGLLAFMVVSYLRLLPQSKTTPNA